MHQMQNLPKISMVAPGAKSTRRTREKTTYKSLALFYVAANALLLAGQLLNTSWSWQEFLLLQWCGFTGVFMIYRFNDIIDRTENFRFHLKLILENPIHVLCLVQFFCITTPAVFMTLSGERIAMLLTTCILGLLYSVNLPVRNRNYRLKHLFLVKNLLIGTLWGSTILIGADSITDARVIALFVFTAVQVMTGSIIRDVPDLEADREDGVRTLPVVFGIPRTVVAIHGLNLLSLAAGWLAFPDAVFLQLMVMVAGWRAVTVVNFACNPRDPLYSNTLNLLTCLLIFFILFIQQINGL